MVVMSKRCSMRVDAVMGCDRTPCAGITRDCYLLPRGEVDPQAVRVVLISEAPPADPADDYYAEGDPLFARTTVQAFNDAGVRVSSVKDILDLGVYLTTAVKCAKTGYGIGSATVDTCSALLERELALFPEASAYLLMGDVAIKALCRIARRSGAARPVPAGSTYKIRGGEYHFGPIRVFPSYVQAGPSFFIERSKREMISQDIDSALRFAGILPTAM